MAYWNPPAPGEMEFGGAASDELDQPFGIAGDVVAHPELGATVLGLDGQEETIGRRFLGCSVLGQLVVEIERAGCVLGRADIEQA